MIISLFLYFLTKFDLCITIIKPDIIHTRSGKVKLLTIEQWGDEYEQSGQADRGVYQGSAGTGKCRRC